MSKKLNWQVGVTSFTALVRMVKYVVANLDVPSVEVDRKYGQCFYDEQGARHVWTYRDKTARLMQWKDNGLAEVVKIPIDQVGNVVNSAKSKSAIFFSTREGEVAYLDSSGQKRSIARFNTNWDVQVYVSPDGQRLAALVPFERVGLDVMLFVYERVNGHYQLKYERRTNRVRDWGRSAFSNDGRRFVVCGATKYELVIYDLENQDADPITCKTPTLGSVLFIEASKDGSRFATLHNNRRAVQVWDFATGESTNTGISVLDETSALAMSGDRIAIAEQDGRISVWDPKLGREVATFRTTGVAAEALTFSKDGRRLLARLENGHILEWRADESPAFQEFR